MDHWDYVVATRNLQNGGPQYKNNLWIAGVTAFTAGIFLAVVVYKYRQWNDELLASVKDENNSHLPAY